MYKPEFYTTDEVAIMLGLSERRVTQAAETFGVKRHGRRPYLFTRDDIEKIRDRIGMQGRPMEVV